MTIVGAVAGSDVPGLLLAGTVAVLGVFVVVLAGQRNRLKETVGAAVLVLIALWLLAMVAYSTDWRDADGFLDCWPTCTRHQQAIGSVLLIAPVMLIVWLSAAVVVWLRQGESRQ
jgi:Ca2+/Na+ antiporter